jgi:hypothetical protein
MSKHSSKKVATDAITRTLIDVVFPPLIEWCQKNGLKKATEDKFLDLLDLSKPSSSVISQSIGAKAGQKRAANGQEAHVSHEPGFCKHRFSKGFNSGKYCPRPDIGTGFCRPHSPKDGAKGKGGKDVHINNDNDPEIDARCINEEKGIYMDVEKKIIFHSTNVDDDDIIALGVMKSTKPLKYEPMSKELARYARSKGMIFAKGAVVSNDDDDSSQSSDTDDPKPALKNKKTVPKAKANTKKKAEVESSDDSSDIEPIVKPAAKKAPASKSTTGKPVAKGKAKPENETKSKVKSDSESDSDSDRKTKGKPDAKTKIDSKAKTDSKTKPDTKAKTDSKTKPDTKTKTDAKAKTDSKSKNGKNEENPASSDDEGEKKPNTDSDDSKKSKKKKKDQSDSE